MLKEEMNRRLGLSEDLLREKNDLLNEKDKIIKDHAVIQEEYERLRMHVDAALCSIEAIQGVNCYQEMGWSQAGINIGDEPPPPPSDLHKALCHIASILCRPVHEPKDSIFNSRY